MIKFCLTALLLLPLAAQAANLKYSLSGIDGQLRENARAWLGDLPESEQQRANFVALAQSRVSSALQALGYYEPLIEIDVDRSNSVWKLQIDVAAGEPVRIRDIDIVIEGEASDDEAFQTLSQSPGFASGDVLHHGKFEDFRNKLLTLTQQRGYFESQLDYARVEVNAGERVADVRVRLDSGPRYRFGDIELETDLVNPDLITSLRGFSKGDPYLQRQLRDLQAEIQRTAYFSSVVVEPQPARHEDHQVPIVITLHPAHRHSFEVGVGYSTDTEERVSLSWRTPRINRYGHSQLTRLIYSPINPSGRINYNIPLTHPLNDFLQLWGRTEENEFGDLDSQQDELGIRREFRRGNKVFGYSLRGLTESWETLGVSRTNDYLLAGTSFSSRSRRGSVLDPEQGFSQLYTAEITNSDLGSDVDLLRLTGLLRYIYTPAPRHRLVGRTELGYADIDRDDRAQLAPSLNFFAGGSDSIRGFGYQSIGNELDITRANGDDTTLVVGGDRLVVLSAEYQYYFTDSWRGSLFADGGDAFDDGEFEWNYGTGFGVHYVSPVGAIRIEFARDISEDNADWRVHFNIGAEF